MTNRRNPKQSLHGHVALIPARGGSKGLPGKNILELDGKPLIQHTIEAALTSGVIDAVYVSTEDPQIKKIAEDAHAKTLDRPPELATDTASSLEVIRHFLDHYKEKHAQWPKTLVLLQPTSPLRTHTHIQEAMTLFEKYATESTEPVTIVSVTSTKPLAWQGRIQEDRQFYFHQLTDGHSNRQQEPQNYLLNGAIYIASPERFYNETLLLPPVYPYPMSPESSVDIDTLLDFQMAEAILERQEAPHLIQYPYTVLKRLSDLHFSQDSAASGPFLKAQKPSSRGTSPIEVP